MLYAHIHEVINNNKTYHLHYYCHPQFSVWFQSLLDGYKWTKTKPEFDLHFFLSTGPHVISCMSQVGP